MRRSRGLDDLVRRRFRFPVAVHPSGPLPKTSSYDPIRNVSRDGFVFELGTLLHAIGSKTAVLPSRDRDECLRASYLFVHLLDVSSSQRLAFKTRIGSDLQTPRSQELGIGTTCLFARRYWRFSWDSMESIPGRGKRFDYRAHRPGLRAIFEAKGTRYRANQDGQIQDGLSKKQAHHRRGEHYDVELVLSTHVGGTTDSPRLLLADPEFDVDRAFGEWALPYFRARHYTRALQFAGLSSVAYWFWRDAQEWFRSEFPEVFGSPRLEYRGYRVRRRWSSKPNLEALVAEAQQANAGRIKFSGQYARSWVPPESIRYERLRQIEKKLIEQPALQTFQGLETGIAMRIAGDNWKAFLLEKEVADIPEEFMVMESGEPASVFSDGTICGFLDANQNYGHGAIGHEVLAKPV